MSSFSIDNNDTIRVGLLAIQGAVSEHEDIIKATCNSNNIKVSYHHNSYHIIIIIIILSLSLLSSLLLLLKVDVKHIRKADDFNDLDGIILPGGESTTMAIVGERWGLFSKLKDWVRDGKPIWGTCAGMILLSDYCIKQAENGQSLVGGLDAHICRNYFGSQISSCCLSIDVDPIAAEDINRCSKLDNNINNKWEGVFIRAPAILKVGSNVQVLAHVTASPHPSAKDEVYKLLNLNNDNSNDNNNDSNNNNNNNDIKVIVGIKQKNILATAFHPELTEDKRWHQYFVNMIMDYKYVDDNRR